MLTITTVVKKDADAEAVDAIAYPDSYKRDADMASEAIAYPDSYKRDAKSDAAEAIAYPDSYKRDADADAADAIAYPDSYKRDADEAIAYPDSYKRDAKSDAAEAIAYPDSYKRDASAETADAIAYPDSYWYVVQQSGRAKEVDERMTIGTSRHLTNSISPIGCGGNEDYGFILSDRSSWAGGLVLSQVLRSMPKVYIRWTFGRWGCRGFGVKTSSSLCI